MRQHKRKNRKRKLAVFNEIATIVIRGLMRSGHNNNIYYMKIFSGKSLRPLNRYAESAEGVTFHTFGNFHVFIGGRFLAVLYSLISWPYLVPQSLDPYNLDWYCRIKLKLRRYRLTGTLLWSISPRKYTIIVRINISHMKSERSYRSLLSMFFYYLFIWSVLWRVLYLRIMISLINRE